MDKKCCSNEGMISLILRIAMASLFGAAAIDKFHGGLENVVTNFNSMFQGTMLPGFLVTGFARVIPWLEAIITIWLVLGICLRWAWFVTCLTLIALSFGMVVAHQFPTASSNYLYVAIACFGLYFSKYDCCSLGKKECCSKE